MFDFSQLLIASAYAQEVTPPPTGDVTVDSGAAFMRFVPLFLILAVFYVLLLRPQQKQAAMHDKLIKELKKGDEVVLRAGMVGKITKIIDDHYVMVELAKGMEVKVVRDTITGPVDERHPSNEKKKD